MSADGILSYMDHEELCDISDAAVVRRYTRAIARAEGEILRTAGQRYSRSGLESNAEIRAFATVLACFYGSKYRANPAPQELVDDVEYIRGVLSDIEQGRVALNGVSLKADLRPTVTNRTVDRRYVWRTIRKRPDSTGPNSVLREDRTVLGREDGAFG